MSYLKKKDGFLGQKAIIIPAKILTGTCEPHQVIKQMYITDIGYYPNAEHHHRHRPHGSKQNILIYCINGKGWARIGKQEYHVNAGEFILLPANIEHEYKANENNPWTIYWVHYKGSNSLAFTEMMMQKMGSPVFSLSFQENRLHLFEEIYTCLEKGYSIDHLCYANISLQYFLASCSFDSIYNYKETKDKSDNIDLCIKFMQKNIDKALTLQEIAEVVNLSPSHIATLFKKKTGFTLIEYFNQLKTQKACQFLLFTDLRVNEIADKLGIEDPYYFTRMFTKLIGISPVKYRAKRRD
jgi:YesN/AraC family two-component response regulator